MQKLKKLICLVGLGAMLIPQIAMAAPSLSFISPTPDHDADQSETTLNAKVDVTESSLKTFTWDWDTTEYTLYDSDLELDDEFGQRRCNR